MSMTTRTDAQSPARANGEDARLTVASGGESQHPDWYVNLMAHSDRASIELPGRDALAVTPHRLDGVDVSRRGSAAWR